MLKNIYNVQRMVRYTNCVSCEYTSLSAHINTESYEVE
jgi:hypothetical protein